MEIDFRVRFAAEQAVKVAAERCGTEAPRIEWTELPAGVQGQTRGSKEAVFLDPRGMSVGQAMLTAAHETRHLHKMRIGSLARFGAPDYQREWAEEDARAFEKEAIRALADRHGDSRWFRAAVEECDEITLQF